MEEPVPITEYIQSLKTDETGLQPKPSTGPRLKLKKCKQVFVDKRDRGRPLPFWQPVRRGEEYGIRILYTNPTPCILAPSTLVTYADSCNYSFTETDRNVVIEERCGKKRHLYAYPKNVWRELYDYYVKPMIEGEEPYNVGVILMGPPGTGKSKLAKIIARYAGINQFTIDTTILSKWQGESENRMREIIENARESQPSIIILDDAEWLLLARKLAGGHIRGGTEETRLNLQQILFTRMQEIYDNEERVLFVATTNVKQDILDQALVRHGRFGPPIFVPLPDLEAARIMVREVLKDKPEEEIEKIAFIAVNAGLSAADTLALAEKVRRGGEPKPRTVSGRGYSRIFVEKVDEFDKLEEEYLLPLTKMFEGRSRMFIMGEEEIATAFAVQIAYSSKKTVMKITDVRYLDEAVHSANMLGSVLIVPSRIPQEIHYYVHDNADVPIIWVGVVPPAVPVFPLGQAEFLINRIGVRAAVKAVAALKGIKVPEGLLAKIERKVAGNYKMALNVLFMIATTGLLDDKYFENMLSWMRT